MPLKILTGIGSVSLFTVYFIVFYLFIFVFKSHLFLQQAGAFSFSIKEEEYEKYLPKKQNREKESLN
jgi:hypothetical protein